ncbi:MAG TPA: hypothetical protein VG826_24990 [Pirellulales bacterium]|nr:hypothetical protein [Pirellulales bacterium]
MQPEDEDKVPGEGESDASDPDTDQLADGPGTVCQAVGWGARRWLLSAAALLVVAFGITAGWWAVSAQRQIAAVQSLDKVGAAIVYSDEVPYGSKIPLAGWLKSTAGHDWSASVVQIKLGRSQVTDEDLRSLENLPSLRFLWLFNTEVGDEGLSHLSSLTRLEELSLGETKITDAGLAHLAGLRKLRFLSLYGTHITDAGLAHLHGLKSLVRIDLQRTGVTAAGVAELRKSLPSANIVNEAE